MTTLIKSLRMMIVMKMMRIYGRMKVMIKMMMVKIIIMITRGMMIMITRGIIMGEKEINRRRVRAMMWSF